MLAFKTAELEAQRENSYAYTAAPAQYLKLISASAIGFLGQNMNRTPSLAQPMDVPYTDVSGHDMVLDQLNLELDTYLHEPLLKHSKITGIQGSESELCVEWCDPLRYWTVCIPPHLNAHFSGIHVGC